MSTLTLILGAPDPEMQAIEDLGRQVGAKIRYALSARGSRVRADEAYQAVALDAPLPSDGTVYAVECDGPAIPPDAIRIDHHRPGDPGYGRPPAEFLPASSIGQVIAELARLGPEIRDGRLVVGLLPWRATSCDYTALAGVQWARAHWSDDPRDHWEGWIVAARSSDRERGGAPWASIPYDYWLAAAADHCLAAAYRGECPGVDPDALMRWRVEAQQD